MSMKTTVSTTASTGTSAIRRRRRYVVMLTVGYARRRSLARGRGPGSRCAARVPGATLFLQPHPPEPRALGLLVEAHHRFPRGAQAEEVAVADDRNLVVEELGLLLPERIALLGVGLAGELGIDGGDLLVGRPPGPGRGEVDVMGRIEGIPDPRGEDVVLLRVHPALAQRGPVHHLEIDLEADVLELLLRDEGEVVHPLVLLGGHEADGLALVAGLLEELLGLVLVVLVPGQALDLRVPGGQLLEGQARVHAVELRLAGGDRLHDGLDVDRRLPRLT